MKMYKEVEVQLHALTLGVNGE